MGEDINACSPLETSRSKSSQSVSHSLTHKALIPGGGRQKGKIQRVVFNREDGNLMSGTGGVEFSLEARPRCGENGHPSGMGTSEL